jgi:hypothetical protein
MGASGAAPDPAAAEAPGAGAGAADGVGADCAGGGAGGLDGDAGDDADAAGGDGDAAGGDGTGALAASASDAASAHAPVKIVAICGRVRRSTGESYRKSRGTSRAKYLCAGQ